MNVLLNMLYKTILSLLFSLATSCVVTTDGPIYRDPNTGDIVSKDRKNLVMPWKSKSRFSKATEKLFKQQENADCVITYGSDGKVDIGVGKVSKGFYDVTSFKLDELVRYFDSAKHKNSIVVIFEKHSWSDIEAKSRSRMLRDYFVARGYRHISIQQAFSSGRSLYLEHL